MRDGRSDFLAVNDFPGLVNRDVFALIAVNIVLGRFAFVSHGNTVPGEHGFELSDHGIPILEAINGGVYNKLCN